MTREDRARRVVEAFGELNDWLTNFRELPEMANTWGDLLIRSILASPEWRACRHACKDYQAATAVLL